MRFLGVLVRIDQGLGAAIQSAGNFISLATRQLILFGGTVVRTLRLFSGGALTGFLVTLAYIGRGLLRTFIVLIPQVATLSRILAFGLADGINFLIVRFYALLIAISNVITRFGGLLAAIPTIIARFGGLRAALLVLGQGILRLAIPVAWVITIIQVLYIAWRDNWERKLVASAIRGVLSILEAMILLHSFGRGLFNSLTSSLDSFIVTVTAAWNVLRNGIALLIAFAVVLRNARIEAENVRIGVLASMSQSSAAAHLLLSSLEQFGRQIYNSTLGRFGNGISTVLEFIGAVSDALAQVEQYFLNFMNFLFRAWIQGLTGMGKGVGNSFGSIDWVGIGEYIVHNLTVPLIRGLKAWATFVLNWQAYLIRGIVEGAQNIREIVAEEVSTIPGPTDWFSGLQSELDNLTGSLDDFEDMFQGIRPSQELDNQLLRLQRWLSTLDDEADTLTHKYPELLGGDSPPFQALLERTDILQEDIGKDYNVTVNQYFYQQQDPSQVREAAFEGASEGLRSLGVCN